MQRPSSVCLSVCKHFAQITSSTTEMAGSPPNLHTMVPRRACIQDVLKVKVKGHVIGTLLWFHENRSLSQANGWNATTMVPSPACIKGVLKVKVEVKGHVIRAHLWYHEMFAIQYGLTFCLYMRSLYGAPLHSPSSISIRQLDLMSKSWSELLRHWRSSSLSLPFI